MEQIIHYIESYGLPVFIIATCIIVLLGVLKLCKVFSKIKNANVKKFIYYAIDIALSFGGAAIYFAAFKIDFGGYLAFSVAQISATTTLYAIYENLGARKLVQMFWNWFGGLIKKDNEHKLIKFAKSLGLDNAIEQIKEYSVKEAERLEAERLEELKKQQEKNTQEQPQQPAENKTI